MGIEQKLFYLARLHGTRYICQKLERFIGCAMQGIEINKKNYAWMHIYTVMGLLAFNSGGTVF
jgi:hypothetical protein